MLHADAAPPISAAWKLVAMLMVLNLTLFGCGQGIDSKAHLDGLINDIWLVDFDTRDAIEYLQNGGTHYDYIESDGTTVDADVVLPLLTRLRDEFQTEIVAVLETEMNWAWVLLVKLPANPVARQQIDDVVQEAANAFEGVISTEWGYQWLAIDFASNQLSDE
jgi:hypothetical protein